MSFVTRFAPSPTGDLHLGSVRTALYCWLFAKKHRGKLILRIEDTDVARSTKEAVEIIFQGLTWLGLTWDEGPIFQSHRFPRYLEVATQLLQADLAYRCDCSKERLEELRNLQLANKQNPKYDGRCRTKNLPSSHPIPYVIRFKNQPTGYVTFNDLIRGQITTSNQQLDDLILIRSDQTPTYNFTVVVDDLDLNITHVIRGEDHISNTPKQINLFTALNAKPPIYAHIPMILGTDGAKLSKRHGATSVLAYKNLGILPEALLNHLAKLGWAHKDQEIFSMQELIELFDINTVHKAAAIFDPEKLLWLNQHYIINYDPQKLQTLVKEHLGSLIDLQAPYNQQFNLDLLKFIDLYKTRVKTLVELATEILYFAQDPQIENAIRNSTEFLEIRSKIKANSKIHAALTQLYQEFKQLDLHSWTAAQLKVILHQIIHAWQLKMPELFMPLRIIIAGKSQTPPLEMVLELLGQPTVLGRLKYAI